MKVSELMEQLSKLYPGANVVIPSYEFGLFDCGGLDEVLGIKQIDSGTVLICDAYKMKDTKIK